MPMQNPNPRNKLRAAFVATLLGATALGGFAAFETGHAANGPVNAPAAVAGQPGTTAAAAQQAPLPTMPDFADLVARVRPAVVQVTNHLAVQPADGTEMQGGQSPFGQQGQSPFGQMPFGFPFGMLPHGMHPMHRAGRRGTRLGLHHRRQRHHRHQQPRGARREVADGDAG